MDIRPEAFPAWLFALHRLEALAADRQIVIEREGISAFADQLAAVLSSAIPASEEYVELSGGFSFKHDGAGLYDLMHECDGCAYVLDPEHVDEETMGRFQHALDQDWIEHLIEAVEAQMQLAAS